MYDEARLEILLDAYFDQELTPAERVELEQMLLASSRARESFWERARHHSVIRQWGMQEWGRKMAEATATEDIPGETPRSAEPEPAHTRLLPVQTRLPWWRTWLGWGFATAIAMVLVLTLAQPGSNDDLTRETPDQGVAVLTRAAGASWADAQENLTPGVALQPGWLRLKEGLVHLEFYSGARLIIEGPAEVQLISATEAYCKYGKLNAYVPEQAQGFKVRSPEVDVLDLGTAFGMNVREAGQSEIHVFGGEVELTRVGLRATSRKLTEGQALHVDLSGETTPIVSAPNEFVSLPELAERQKLELKQRLQSWMTSSAAIGRDSATLVHYTFDGEPDLDRQVKNQIQNPAASTAGSIVGCEWVPGRWPGKMALEFKTRSDRVRLKIPGRHEALTYAAWLRVDSLARAHNGLLLSDDLEVGEPRWELGRQGQIRFGIRVEPKAWEHAISPPVITPDRFGQWIHLVTTVDTKTRAVCHYLNGEKVAELRLARTVPIHIGSAELGNWGVRPDNPRLMKNDEAYITRPLSGRIDEFTVASRVLTAEEIRSRYAIGKPAGMTIVAGNESSAGYPIAAR